RAKQTCKPYSGIVEQCDHARIEVTDRGRGHGTHDAWRRQARPRAHQDALGVRKEVAHLTALSSCASASRKAATPASGTWSNGARGTPTSEPAIRSAALRPGTPYADEASKRVSGMSCR